MKQKAQNKRWSEIDQLIYDWKGWSVYDNPADAERFGTVVGSSSYLGYNGWRKWIHQHYVGEGGYDHKTGKITHPKLKEFFDKQYPDFEEQQRRRQEGEIS